jgi:hypothetical protein
MPRLADWRRAAMPRPTTKIDLLEAADREYRALEAMLAPLTQEQMLDRRGMGGSSVKDVLAHLVEWQQMVLGWYRAGLNDETPEMPAPGFKWNQTPQLNQAIHEKHRDRPLEEVVESFERSHRETVSAVEGLSDAELFTAGLARWTSKNTMGTYFVSATSSHYVWARKKIRKGLKAAG